MASLRVLLALLFLACTLNAFESIEQEKIAPSIRKKRLNDLIRRKRSPQVFYSPWTPPYLTAIIKIPVQQGLSLWQPQPYQINRPYFIPVLGAAGKIPIYFPPQPIHNNPGFPIDNPPSNTYLPPKPEEVDNTTVSTINKFDDDGDRPVWGMSGNENRPTTVRPTRRPRPSALATSTHPPIVRDERTTVSSVVTTTSNSINSFTEAARVPAENLPSRCVWAIISCCSASSNSISYDCFEQLGCNGAFWGDSPCDGEIAKAAISNVMNYYQSK